jgi:hypothetical protein
MKTVHEAAVDGTAGGTLVDVGGGIMRFFEYEHLPERLAKVSRPFCDLARSLVLPGKGRLPDCEERAVALRKLLEAKDAAVRAALSADGG